jgi:hypothetical protein
MNSTNINKMNGQLVSFTVEGPTQNVAPSSPSMPALIPASSVSYLSSTAHNDEQSMLWQNVASLFVKFEDNQSNIDGLRGEYEKSVKELKEFTVELYARLQSARGEIAAVKTNSKNKLKSFKKAFQRKIKKVKQVSASSACDADMEVFKYIDTLRIQIDELRATTEKQNAKIDELSHVTMPISHQQHHNADSYYDIHDLQHKMNKMREELADLNELYDNDYYRFCKREDELKDKIGAAHAEALISHTFAITAKQNSDDRIDAAIKAIETWGSDIYKLDEQVKNMNREIRDDMEIERQSNEYWVERALKTFEQEKLSRIKSQISEARSYADTKVAGDLRQEFADAICREVAFESKVSADLVQGVHNELSAMNQGVRTELVDLITRSNEIHSARYFQSLNDMQIIKDDSTSMCQTLKHSIGLVDMELSEVKEILDFAKEDIASLSVDMEDQKEEIKDTIYSEMDADYRELKRYIRHKMKNHLRDEHPVEDETDDDEDAAEADPNDQNDENAGEEVSEVVNMTIVESIVENNNDDNNDDMVIIMDDENCRFSDDD